MARGSFAWRRLTEYLDEARDLFGMDSTNVVTDLIDVPGEHDFTPERLRYYKDGTRRYLEYGTDANYTETPRGRTLAPDSDQTLTINLSERAAYPVGADLWPSMSYSINKAPQAGDVVAGGYGIPDLVNFDPVTVSYAAGSNADGWFWYHTAETGLENVILAGVGDGSIYYHTDPITVYNAANILSVMETRLNWYGVGPGKFIRSYTNITDYPNEPNRNQVLGYVANDNGPSSLNASHRASLSIHQAAGNSGLELMAGSMSVKSSGEPDYQFKVKGHEMRLNYTNPTEDYEVVGALRGDPARPEVKLRIPDITITKTPGNGTTTTRIIFIAVDTEESNAPTGPKDGTLTGWRTPPTHNPTNSVVEEIWDNTLTGPDYDGAGTDISGPDLAGSMNNPGGFQVGRDSITVEGIGGAAGTKGSQVGLRNVYDTDLVLILARGSTAGEIVLDVATSQNS